MGAAGLWALKHLLVCALCEFQSSNSSLDERPRIKLEVVDEDGHLEYVGQLLMDYLLVLHEEFVKANTVFFDRSRRLGREVDEIIPVTETIVGDASFEMLVNVLEKSNAIFVVKSILRDMICQTLHASWE